jgi:aconitate hydratase
LGVKAVIVESFERIHRSNLVGMGVLPLQFKAGTTRQSLGLNGTEVFDLEGVAGRARAGGEVKLTIQREDGSRQTVNLDCRLDTQNEVDYFNHGGILQYVMRKMVEKS